MRIKELIAHLQEIADEYGDDLEVWRQIKDAPKEGDREYEEILEVSCGDLYVTVEEDHRGPIVLLN